jgi:hypothetical protein
MQTVQISEKMTNMIALQASRWGILNSSSKYVDVKIFAPVVDFFHDTIKYLVNTRTNGCYVMLENPNVDSDLSIHGLNADRTRWITGSSYIRLGGKQQYDLKNMKKLADILLQRFFTSYYLSTIDPDLDLVLPENIFMPTVKIEGSHLEGKIDHNTTLKKLLERNSETNCPVCYDKVSPESNFAIQDGCRHLMCTRCAENWFIAESKR